MGIPFGVSLFLWGAGLRTLRVGSSEAALGAQRPGGPADSGGGARLSLEESRRKEHQGGRGSSSLDPPFLVWGDPARVLSFFCLACGPVSYARNGPPTGWAGWGRWFRRREEFFPPPKPSPRGGRWAGEAGSDEGATLYPTFPCRKEGVTACRPNGIFLLPRWASRSPPHQSPSVTASPQGEASGLCCPTRKSAPNQGTQMGAVIAPPPKQCGTTAKTSERVASGP